MNITGKLASLVEGIQFGHISENAILEGKKCFIDGIGIAVNGSTAEPSRILKKYLVEAGGNEQATTLGSDSIRTSMSNAALFNGVACHVLDYDDTQAELGGHPTAVILPVVLSVGEHLKADGKECLNSLIVGIETSCRIGKIVNPGHYRSGYHVTATIGIFGATAAAGKLLGLSWEELGSAFGMAGSMSSGLKQNFGTMTKSLHVGSAASNGIICALLAKKGFGGSKEILEGKMGFIRVMGGGSAATQDVLEEFGKPWEIEKPGICRKKYACCARTHGAIEGIRKIVESHRFDLEDIKKIECGTDDTALQILGHPFPKTGLEAKFSMPFCITMALLKTRILPEHFSEKYIRDPIVAGVMKKVKHFADIEITKRGYEHRGDTSIKVILQDGRELNEVIRRSMGSGSEALTEEEVISKFSECVGRILDDTKAGEAIEMLRSLDLQRDISKIIHCCIG